jgi:hypothetical protein
MRSTYAMRTNRSSGVRQSKRYWYYTSKRNGPEDDSATDRLPAAGLEAIVDDALRVRLFDRAWLAASMGDVGIGPEAISKALDRASEITVKIADTSSHLNGSAGFLHRVDLQDAALRIQMNLALLLDQLGMTEVLVPPIVVPITLRQRGRNRPIVLYADPCAPRRDPDLIALVADARRWMDDLIEDRAASVAEITERERLRPGNVSRVLPLAWLAPDIAASILEGRQPDDLTAKTLRDLPDLPLGWEEQRRILGFPAV